MAQPAQQQRPQQQAVPQPEFRAFLAALVGRHDADAVALACTELPLALSQADVAMPLVNPTEAQCREAFEFYAHVLGGKITAAFPYADAPPGMPITDPKYKSWLMHCWLEVGDQALMGADMDVG